MSKTVRSEQESVTQLSTVCIARQLAVTFQLSCPWLRPLGVSHPVWLTQHMCCWAGLKAAPSFHVSAALLNEAWLEVSSPLQPGPHRRISGKILKQSCALNLLLICFCHYDPTLSLTSHTYTITATLNTDKQNHGVVLAQWYNKMTT